MTRRQAPGRTTRLLLRAAAGLVLAAAAVLAGAGTASAHAVLESTDPQTGSVLGTRPTAVALTFGESVQLPPGGLRIFDPAGVQVDDGQSDHPGGAGNTVRIGLRPGADLGSYTVSWRVISADTHPVSGAFTFSVGHPSATSPATPAAPRGSPLVGGLYAAVRAAAYGSFAALVGAAAFVLFCRPGLAAGDVARRVALGGGVGLAAMSVATLLLQGPYGDGTGLGDMFSPAAVASTLHLALGGALVARLLLLGAAAVYLRRLFRHSPDDRRRPAMLAVGGLLAVGMAATWAVAGHSAMGLQPALALPVDVAHLVAMAVWLGGLAVLTGALRRPPPGQVDDLARAIGRFSPIALGCVVVLVATGSYQSWRQLGSWSAFVDTDYGLILLAKLLTVGALLAVAGLSRRAVHRAAPEPVLVGTGAAGDPAGRTGPAGDPDERAAAAVGVLRRTVLVEAVAAVAVLILTAVLVNSEPGRTAEAAAAGAVASGPVRVSAPFDTEGPGGQGTLDVVVDPARTGPDTVEVSVHDRSGRVLDPAELDVAFLLPDRTIGPLKFTVARTAPGRYAASGQVPIAGRWQLAITVRTSEVDQTTVRLPVPIG